MLVTPRQIGGRSRGAGLIGQKIDERPAGGVDGAVRFRTGRRCLRRYPGRCEGGVTVDTVDGDDVVVQRQEAETELQPMVPARHKSVVVNLEDLAPDILLGQRV